MRLAGIDSSGIKTSLASDLIKDVDSRLSDPKVLRKNNDGYYIKDKRHVPWYIKYKFKWAIIASTLLYHTIAIYTLITFPYIQKYKTFLYALLIDRIALFGVTGGVHRLWAHKCYKATLPLQILLAIAYVSSLQATISTWVRIHRVHHKFTDTDADPHDSTKGFFFSHVGWLLVKRPQEVVDKFKEIDMSDIKNNKVISFFDRHYGLCSIIISAIIISIPVYFWNEEWKYSFLSQVARLTVTSNVTFCINSVAHIWGDKPFNKSIYPVDGKALGYLALGEGWHNYHHTFPSDYRTPEFLGLRYFDFTGKGIELFEKIGWAYDLRKSSDNVVKRTIKNKGDEQLQALAH